MAIFGENDRFTLVRCDGDAEWLEERRKGIGGSDVAAVMGLSPWKTPAQLWMEKTGRVESDDIGEKPYVAFGNIMEPIVGKWFAKQHPEFRVRRVNAICQSIERPWAQASLDYEVYDGNGWGVLEIKTARTASDWSDGVPDYYLTQVLHYLDVTGRDYAYVAVFFRDTCEFAEYHVDRDEDDVACIRAAVDDFWNDYVLEDVMPMVVGTSGEASDLASMWPSGSGFTPAGTEADELIAAYQDAARRERQAKAEKTEASTKLIELIGDAKGLSTDVARVTWVRGERETFDVRALKAKQPDVYARYASTTFRNGGIRVKELK